MANKFTARIEKAKKQSEKALAIFQKAQAQLIKETEELNATVAEIDKEIEDLRNIRNEFVEQSNINTKKIVKLSDFSI